MKLFFQKIAILLLLQSFFPLLVYSQSFSEIKEVNKPVSVHKDTLSAKEIASVPDSITLNYFQTSRGTMLGSVSSIDGEVLYAYPVANPYMAMQGRASGVYIHSQNAGEPNADVNIQIRGINSVFGNQKPLIVVDGFVGAELPPAEEISSVDVLKDAYTTSIFGARGANGVLVVKTKRGMSGLRVDVQHSISRLEASDKYDLLDADQFTDYMNEFIPYENQGGNTDWQDMIRQTGQVANSRVAVYGGKEKVDFYLGYNRYNQTGVIKETGYGRHTINGNLQVKPTKWLNLKAYYYGKWSHEDLISNQNRSRHPNEDVLGVALRYEPDLNVYDDNGEYTTSRIGDLPQNPLMLLESYDGSQKTRRNRGNLMLEFDLSKAIKFKSTWGASSTRWEEDESWSSDLTYGGESSLSEGEETSFLTENYFTIEKNTKLGQIQWLAGYSFQSIENVSSISVRIISNDSRIDNAERFLYSETSESTLTSFYTNMYYSWNDQYLLSFNLRYDGSSLFHEDHKWELFPSVAAAWNIKKYSFMNDLKFISDLKLRSSYGVSGNYGVQSFSTTREIASINSPFDNIYGSGENLMMEKTKQLDIGIDLSLFQNRLNFSLDHYTKESSNLYAIRAIPLSAGFNINYENSLGIRNQGVDLAVESKNLVKAFKWNTHLAMSFMDHEVTSLPYPYSSFGTAPEHLNVSGGFQLLTEGDKVGAFYGYVYQGVQQTESGELEDVYPGGELYEDIEADNQINDLDRKVIGDPNPNWIWSMENSFGFKNFQLRIYLLGVHGHDKLNLTKMELETLSGRSNVSTAALDRWTMDNRDTDIPSARADRPFIISDRWVEDASFVRLQNVSLSYTFNPQLLKNYFLRSLQVYCNAQNLWTFTNYSGSDPEVNYPNANSVSFGTNMGVEYAAFPSVRSYLIGLNIGF